MHILFVLSDIRETLVVGTLRREKVFSDEFFHGHYEGVNVGTFRFEATVSREPKCERFWGLKVQALMQIN